MELILSSETANSPAVFVEIYRKLILIRFQGFYHYDECYIYISKESSKQ